MKKILITLCFVFALIFASNAYATPKDVAAPTYRINGGGDMYDGYEFGRPAAYAVWLNDFFTYATGDWTITTVETGASAATESLQDAVYGVLRIQTDTTDAGGDYDSLQLVGESFLPTLSQDIYCELRIAANGTIVDTALTFGLVVTDTTPLSHANGIVFKKDDNDASLDFTTTSGSVTSTDAAIATVVDGTYMKLGFRVKGTDEVEYWINDSKIGSFTTNIPTTEMRPTLYIANTGATVSAYSIDVDYFTCAENR